MTKPTSIHPRIFPTWRLVEPDSPAHGSDSIDLLREIGRAGSLREAAKACGISYRTAWSRVHELNQRFPEPLVLSVNGGPSGGESLLTPAARELVETHDRADALFQQALGDGGIDPRRVDSWMGFLKRISMKTSARNQLFGIVDHVVPGAVNSVVGLRLPGGQILTAQVTRESERTLGLSPGRDAWALVKASWVSLSAGPEEPRVSARNRLAGKVASIRPGKVTAEVELELPGGDRIVSNLSLESLSDLGLRKGRPAWAFFKASSVILGTLG